MEFIRPLYPELHGLYANNTLRRIRSSAALHVYDGERRDVIWQLALKFGGELERIDCDEKARPEFTSIPHRKRHWRRRRLSWDMSRRLIFIASQLLLRTAIR